jgi:hypothetical protein
MNKAEAVVGMKEEGNSRKRNVQSRIEKKNVKHIAQTYKQKENKGKQTKQNKEELHKTKKPSPNKSFKPQLEEKFSSKIAKWGITLTWALLSLWR